MALIKWEPFNELDKLFEDRFSPSFPRLSSDLAVDVYEENNNVVAKMSLPGVKTDEVDISVEDDMLTVSGRREEEKETKNKDYYSKEIRRGSFTRTVSLPKRVEATKADAKFSDGILMVTLPITKGAKEKSVKVKIKK